MAISWTDVDVTVTINMPSPLGTVYATGSSVTFTIPKVQAKATGSYMTPPFYLGIGQDYSGGWGTVGAGLELKNGSTTIKELRGHSSKSVAKNTYVDIAYSTSASVTLTTSSYFKSTNPTARTVTLNLVAPQYCVVSPYEPSTGSSLSCTNPSAKTLSTVTLTLDVPPTATVSAISYDTPYVYAGLTTASVTVSGSAAYYGGSVTDVTLTIGNQSDSLSGDGTLSIALDTAGTFTPTVTVTDSRGQTKSYPLDPITVMTYAPPTVTFTAERTTSAGIPDDEGTYATCPSTFVFADVIATAIAPSVVLTDENGTQTTPTVTWYSSRAADGTLSGPVTWSSLSSGDTVYGLIPGLNPNYSYQISVQPRDSEGTGTAIVQTVSSAFYTVDFLAGGHGIAFGQPSSQDGFYCNMDANFMKDVLIDLPDYQTTGTTDKAIYDAVVALGWDSDVIV